MTLYLCGAYLWPLKPSLTSHRLTVQSDFIAVVSYNVVF